jgi:tRNA U54 and U55 pseudouridine synthase Pus10
VYCIVADKDVAGQYIEVDAEAGTYIKELISGDEGRTKPSISEFLGRPIKCTQLVVSGMKDSFLDFCFNKQQLLP